MTRTRRARRHTRLVVQNLEDRTAPANLTVTGTGDTVAVDGVVTLREAITSANNNANVNDDVAADGDYGTDTIRFNIPALDPGHLYYRTDTTAGQVTRANVTVSTEADDADIGDIDPDHPHSWFSISPASALPTITGPLIVDGYSQAGASANTNSVESLQGLNTVLRIELDGTGAGDNKHGLSIGAGSGSEIRGLVLNRFANSGIRVIANTGDAIVVAGNFLGTDMSGTVDLGNGGQGVLLEGLTDSNRLGGTTPADRNLISGNNGDGILVGDGSSLNQVSGNLIGTDITGTRDLGNSRDGVSLPNNNFDTSNNVIGGSVAGSRNIISGNDGAGISLTSGQRRLLNNVIQGNYIGTDVSGTAAIRNASDGIAIAGAINTAIGGTTAATRNVISGNQGNGITDFATVGSPLSQGTVIAGNYIGTQADGLLSLGNARDGVRLNANTATVGGTEPGAGNVIAFNGESGVFCFAGTADIRGNSIFNNSGNGAVVQFATTPILDNSIFGNGGLGIELSNGTGVTPNDPGDTDSGPNAPNGLQNFPVLLETLNSAVDSTIFASLNSLPQTEFLIQFFVNDAADATGHGEGQIFLGETIVRTNSSGNVSFSFDVPVLLAAEQQVTATATRLFDHDSDPNTQSAPIETSEFSRAISGAASILELGQTIERDVLLGQEIGFRLNVPPGVDARLTAHFTDSRIGEILVRVGDLPDVNSFDQRVVAFVNPDPEFLLPGSPAPYFIRVRGTSTAAVPVGRFSLTAQAVAPEVDSIAPNRGSNAGQVTTTIVGTGFSAETVFSLVGPGGERLAASTVQQSETAFFVAFNLTGLPEGSYSVRAVDGLTSDELADAFSVNSEDAGRLKANLVTPFAIRRNRESVLIIEYENEGGTDIPAPLLLVVSDNSLLAPTRLLTSVGGGSSSGGGTFLSPPSGLPPASPRPIEPVAQFLAISRSGPAGVLPPGAKERFEIRFQDDGSQTPGFHPSLRFKLLEAGAEGVEFDLESAKPDMRPSTVSPEAWDVIFSNLLARVGFSVGSYVQALRDSATYLSRYGVYTGDIDQLLTLHFAQADNALPGGSLHATLDAAAPASGVPLVWGRTFAPSISRRFDDGILGRGWSHPWDLRLSRDAEANDLLIRTPVGTRRFSELPDGTFLGSILDPAQLTLANGVFTLREANGTLSRLDESTGRLLDVTDRNGHKVTLDYVDGRLDRLLHSNGGQFDLRYNTAGRLDQLTDQVGRMTTYEYDPTGEHLIQVTGPDGVWEYTYETTVGALHEHALESVTAPDGSHLFYEYDGRGRLIRTSRDGEVEAVTIDYGSAGEVFVTDAFNKTTSLFFNDIGQPLEVRDALGRSARFDYDLARQLDRLSLPQDTVSLFDFDANGNLIFVVKPDGRSLSFRHDRSFNQVMMIRDERGVQLLYTYDDQGNLTSILHADGSRERFTPDADGNLEQSINRRDQVISYTYDDRGLLRRKDHAEGTVEEFTYDDRGNMRTATDESGTTTFDYDGADRLTKVTYPNGRFLQYTYDDGGRRIRLEDQDGFVVKYRYDAAGRIAELTDGSDARLILYTYDLVGRLGREDNGNGTFTTYDYDDAGQLTSLVNHLPDGVVSSRFDYTYDALGRRTSVTTLEGSTTFGYDAIGQLTLVVLPDGRTIQYEYDAAGNRTAVIDNGVTTTYEPNDLNQYERIGSFERTYDLDGNLITDEAGGGRTFTYDDESRLLRWVDGVLSVGYEYDALGNRTAKVEEGGRTEYLVDPLGLTNVVAEYDGDGNLIARYVHGGFGLVSRHDAEGSAAFFDFDAVGSTVSLTDAAANVVNRYSYLPFGEALTITETLSNPFEYVGQFGVERGANGLDFMRARFYSSEDGRFINEDPIGALGGLNLYQYSANQPNQLIDPAGLIPILPGVTPEIVTGTSHVIGGAAASGIGQAAAADAAIASAAGAGTSAGAGATGSATASTAGVTTEVVASGVAQGGKNTFSIIGRGAARYLGPAPRGFVTISSLSGMLRGSLFGAMLSVAWFEYENDFGNIAIAQGGIGDLLADLVDSLDPNLNPPAPPGVVLKEGTVEQRTSTDPNDIIGPAGFGPDQFLQADSLLFYTIRFENLATASVPAQEVGVTQTLDPDLDFTTFEFLSFGIGSSVVTLPAGRTSFSLRFDLRPERNLFLDVIGDLNQETGVITWRFRSLDPTTLELPEDPDGGFLSPNVNAPEGEGFVTYIVRPREGSPTGTRIDAQARIVFDVNEPIDTPAIAHTLDAGTPSASVNSLPERTIGTTVNVSWAGTDDTGGSGVAAFDVFVSDNGGPFVPLRLGTTETSATFTAEIGHTYGFLAVAIDHVGHRQPRPAVAQASTTLVPVPFQIRDLDLVAKPGRVTELVLRFNQPVAAEPAGTLANYRLTKAGPDRRFGTADDRVRRLATAIYDPLTNTVRLRPALPLINRNFFRLTVEGDTGLTTPDGEPLDGNGDTVPGGDFDRIFGRGTLLAFSDSNGDRVVLRLTNGGVMELTRDLSGEGLDLVLSNTKPGKSVLTGTVRKPKPQVGDKLTTLRSISGLDGVTNRLTEPPFVIGDR